MSIFDVNKYFDTADKPNNYKKSIRAMNIWIMVAIAISMIAIWGNVTNQIGINYYIYDGWKELARMGDSYRYAMFIPLIILFLGALIVTYFFGVKALVQGIKCLANKEDCNICSYFLIICIVNFIYFNFGNSLANGTFALSRSYAGWGRVLSGLVLIPTLIGIIIYAIIMSFNKEKIPEFVGKMFLSVTLFLLVAIMSNAVSGYFNSSGAEVGMYYPFGASIQNQYESGTKALLIAQGIVGLATYFLAFYVAVETLIYIFSGNEVNGPKTLIAPGILLILTAFSMFTNGLTEELITNSSRINISTEVISSFICSVVTLTFYLTNYFITEKR